MEEYFPNSIKMINFSVKRFVNEKTIIDIDQEWVMLIDDQPRNLTKKIVVK